jgi:predicted DNA-binding transcriptional regulator YafY
MRSDRPKPPAHPPAPSLTRRALGTRIAGAAAAFGLVPGAVAGGAAAPVLDPDLRDAALRGLALAGYRGDPVTAAAANAALDRLAEADPEAALLARVYRLLDVRPAAWWPADQPEAAAEDLATLHAAIRACQPVAFGYTDLSGQVTERRVLPLALVHPAQGVKLLAWCEMRQDFRQFFVRAMREPVAQPGDFTADRLTLLEGLLAKESGRGR